MQFGRGMIQGISEQMFKQFAASVQERLESIEAQIPVSAESEPVPTVVPEQKPINAVAVTFAALWSGLVGFFRRLFTRGSRP
jgi:hypothetical protein